MFRKEQPDYYYLRNVFRYLREELEVPVKQKGKKLPRVPSEKELKLFYEAVWKTRNTQDLVIIKTFLYTGVRVSELVVIRLKDIDLDLCQIRVNQGKGKKDRIVPFPRAFREVLALHMTKMEQKGASYLFESKRRKSYTDRGIRKMIKRYAEKAGLENSLSPHQFRHFLLTWLKKQGIDDAMIQPYSGHASRKSLEVYSQLSIKDAQGKYEEVINQFPI
ncbi:MAG: tyrosine-type recombinase/integrase [Bacteroidota bacterium]